MLESTSADPIKDNIKIHLITLLKLLFLAGVVPYLALSIILGSFSIGLLYYPLIGPLLITVAKYVQHMRGYWDILHVTPSNKYQEHLASSLTLEEVAKEMSYHFRFKKYEEGFNGLKFLLYPEGITFSDYLSIEPVKNEKHVYKYKVVSETPGVLSFLNLQLDGGRNYRNVQKVKTLISLD